MGKCDTGMETRTGSDEGEKRHVFVIYFEVHNRLIAAEITCQLGNFNLGEMVKM